jgi:hypothetical protein
MEGRPVADNNFAGVVRYVGRPSTESLVISLTAARMSGGSPSVSAKDPDVRIDGGFTAIRHAELGYTLAGSAACQRHRFAGSEAS